MHYSKKFIYFKFNIIKNTNYIKFLINLFIICINKILK